MEIVNSLSEWFLSLGKNYNVNPYIFGGIYIGAIPFFFFFLGLTIKKIRAKQHFSIPLILTVFCFISAYLYLLIVGENIPLWVYACIGILILYGAYSTYVKIKQAKE